MSATVIRGPWPRHRCPCAECQDRPPPSPPNAEYLAARERLGLPSRTADLAQPCPWCGATSGASCQVIGHACQPHPSRQAQ